jgi:NTE family protein
MLAGTSAGSLFGGLYAAGIPIDSIVELALGFHKELSVRALLDFNIPPRTGLLRGRRFLNFLDRLFGGIQFEDLEIPFFVVSADALTGEEIVFEKGPVADAVRASTSIVGIMSPHEYQGRQLIDGGAVNPLPVSVLARKGSDIIIASRAIPTLEDELESKRTTRSVKSLNIMGLLGNTQSIMEREIIKTRLDLIDVLIYPRVEAYTSMEYRQAAQLIRLGEESAQQAIPIIKEKLTPASG